MKKLLMVLFIVVCVVALMAGCSEEKKETSQKALDEFTKLVETKNALKVKKFISHNIDNVSQETADKMIVEYEEILNNNFMNLFKKYNSSAYFNAINGTMDEEHNLHLKEIKNDEIKNEVMKTIDSGYTFERLEGDYYLTIDYGKIYDDFNQYVSEDLKSYYKLRKKELENPMFVEEYVSADFEEIKNRVTTLEKVIRDNENLANKPYVKDLMQRYIQALLSISYFNKMVDYKTGVVQENVKKTYEELKSSDLKISKYAATEMDKLLSEYKYVLKPDNEEAYKKVNSLKFKIVALVGKKIEEYYSTK